MMIPPALSPSWKRLSILLTGVIILQLIFTHQISDVASQAGFPTTPRRKLLPWDQLPTGVDGEILDNLSDAQCDFAFPDLYHEVDRATTYWQQRDHTISGEDTNITWRDTFAMRLLIHDNQIRVLQGRGTFDNGWFKSRSLQTLFLLHRSVESATAAGEVLPTVEIALTMADITEMPAEGTNTVWTWNRRLGDEGHERHWMMPNFDMWRGVGNFSYRDSRLAAKRLDAPFANKVPKIVWRGYAIANMEIRQKLLDVVRGKPWADVLKLDGNHEEFFLDNDKLCNYAMTVHTEGVSYSGRLKWLTSCNSLISFHERSWDMYFYHLLEATGPNQNYVAVKRDWSDLEEKVKYYLDHPEEAERIIANSLATFRDRYLTRAADSCYTRKLIRGYANVSFTPDIHRPGTEGSRMLRGDAFEMFMQNPHDIGDASS